MLPFEACFVCFIVRVFFETATWRFGCWTGPTILRWISFSFYSNFFSWINVQIPHRDYHWHLWIGKSFQGKSAPWYRHRTLVGTSESPSTIEQRGLPFHSGLALCPANPGFLRCTTAMRNGKISDAQERFSLTIFTVPKEDLQTPHKEWKARTRNCPKHTGSLISL